MNAETNSTANGSRQLPSFSESPTAFLHAIAQHPPSKDLLAVLAGNVASSVKTDTNPQVAALYLQAVARHLPMETSETFSATSTGSSAAGNLATVRTRTSMEAESSQHVSTIITAVGHAVALCTPRSLISQSGILPVLANLCLPATASQLLTPAQVEFLQGCVYAEQYRYAERAEALSDDNTWPRPNGGVTIQHVLRYYYLRGTIHMACNHWRRAIRCFWTCLSIPADTVSSIAVAAYKKLVLVQCLLHCDQIVPNKDASMFLALPQAAPTCLSRMVNAATSPSSPSTKKAVPEVAMPHTPEVVMMVESPTEQGGQATTEGGNNSGGARGDSTTQQSGPVEILQVYVELVRAFVAVNRSTFDQICTERQAIFEQEGNLGMVHQCRTALLRRHLYQVSEIYSAIPLDRLARLLELSTDQVQSLLLQVSVEQTWAVDVQQGMVRFPARTGSQQQPEDVVLPQLTYQIRNLDCAIAASSKYATLTRKDKKKDSSKSPMRGPRGVEDV